MKDETQGTGTAAAEVEQHEQQSTAGTEAAGTQTEANAEVKEEKTEEPARTGATDTPFIPPAVAAAPGQIEAGGKARSPANAVVIRRLVTYVAGDDDVSHGVLSAGIGLAAVIVKVNEYETVNLHVFAADSAATLFKANVAFGTLPGQCYF